MYDCRVRPVQTFMVLGKTQLVVVRTLVLRDLRKMLEQRLSLLVVAVAGIDSQHVRHRFPVLLLEVLLPYCLVRQVAVVQALERVVQVLVCRRHIHQVAPSASACQLHSLLSHFQLLLVVEPEHVEVPQLRKRILPYQRIGIPALLRNADRLQEVAHGPRVVLQVAIGTGQIVIGSFRIDGIVATGKEGDRLHCRVGRRGHDVLLVPQADGEQAVLLPDILRSHQHRVLHGIGSHHRLRQRHLAQLPRLFNASEQLPLILISASKQGQQAEE